MGKKVIVYEADVLKDIMLTLKAFDILFTRNNVGAVKIRTNQFYRFGTPGWSDIIGMAHDGRFLAIEAKRPGGKLSENQKVFLERVNSENGIGIVVDNIESLFRQLKERKVIN